MSKRRRPGCGKRRFPDRIAAMLSIANIEARGRDRNGRIPCRAYLCPTCGGWHLTSTPLGGRRVEGEAEWETH